MAERSTFCKDCEHCDTNEARILSAGSGAVARHVAVGICTRRWNFFNAKYVPDWLTGCPDYDAREAVAS